MHRGKCTHRLFVGLLPKSALTVEEEAWNAYPYTKTRYTCPFVEKFSLEIETYYFPDDGHQENVFKLDGSDMRNRIVGKSPMDYRMRMHFLFILLVCADVIDIVKEQLYGHDYTESEDPKLYISSKTKRGPLFETWLEDYWNEVIKHHVRNTSTGEMWFFLLFLVANRWKANRSRRQEICHWCAHINCAVSSSGIGACKPNWRNSYTTQRCEKPWYVPNVKWIWMWNWLNLNGKTGQSTSTGLGLARRMARLDHGGHSGIRAWNAVAFAKKNGRRRKWGRRW